MKKFRIFIPSLVLSFLISTSPIYGLSFKIENNNTINATENCYILNPLPYEIDALEPYIDSATLELHHNKHEQSYVNNLNASINKALELKCKSLEELLSNPKKLPKDLRTTILNNAGGVYNHNFFWQSLSPTGGGNPIGNLNDAIEAQFGSFENFKSEFERAGLSVFGSGWAWLLSDNKGNLSIETTANQDTPLPLIKYPILNLDLWEHAYYLKYQNRRNEYISAFWNIANWTFAENNYINAFKN